MRNKKKGFTLVELIVVIAIIGVLAAIIVPTTLHFVNQARDQAATEELDRVVSAFDSGLTEVIANMSGADTIEEADIASIVSKAGITADALENTITVSITNDSGTMKVVIKSDYDDDAAYEALYADLQQRFPAYKMYAMRLSEDYLDFAEEYLVSVDAIEWE